MASAAEDLPTPRIDGEIARLRLALKRNPQDGALLLRLGEILMQAGRWREAAGPLRAAVQAAPANGEARAAVARIAAAMIAAGDTLAARGEHRKALAAFRDAVAADPGPAAQARLKLGETWRSLAEPNKALAAWRGLVSLVPDHFAAHLRIAETLRETGRTEEAAASFERSLAIDRESLPVLRALVELYGGLNRPADCLAMCERILERAPDDVRAKTARAAMLEALGRAQEAFEALRPLLEAGNRDPYVVTIYGKVCERLDPPREDAVALLRAVADDERIAPKRRVKALWALVHLCDALGRYDEAFAHAQALKAIERGFGIGKSGALRGHVDAAIEAYTAQRLARLPRAKHGSRLPVFVVGMFRSGTTLVEQILASHPRVFGAGELLDLTRIALGILPAGVGYPQCLDALTQERVEALAARYLEKLRSLAPAGAARVIDKLPNNFEHLGLVQLLFPEARIVHCVRDPLDTCLSMYFLPDTGATETLQAVGAFYLRYRRIMEKWRRLLELPTFTLEYEALLARPQEVVRELLAFCGLEWSDACMKFHETERFAGTFSYHQVRKPLYLRSAGRYRNYEKHLGPLKAVLGEYWSGPRAPA